MSDFAKRILDFTVALVALIVLSPLLVAIALAIRLAMGSPIFFRQLRPGYRSHPFQIIKFRTMTVAGSPADASVDTSRDAARLTPLGRFLRRTSLDELPELWNVLTGSMSLVGPRPLLIEYLPLYSPEQARRHNVKPGITGWAQVNGRNDTTWERKFALDLWYVDHRSFWLDLRILAMTVLKVLRREGISQQGHATTEKFGSRPAG
jgi:lipopolysaccharide/colanic/teichoic acid biosynthesis glycosyltransferase